MRSKTIQYYTNLITGCCIVKGKLRLDLFARELELMEQWYLCMKKIEEVISKCDEKIDKINKHLEEEV